ncbi:hypothetical protein BC835DRAFT_1416143 [Cytidiella melzeri]|nr:hypothetical protein BC835DRAFT_1416143 [Cytidiella melzeri]
MSPSTSLRVLCGLAAALTAVSVVNAECLGATSFMSLYGLGTVAGAGFVNLFLVPGVKAAPYFSSIAKPKDIKRGDEVADFWVVKRGDGLEERSGPVAEFWKAT